MVVPLAPEHADAAARLHIAGQPGTFLTALGLDVLTVLYTVLPQPTSGFGFAALDAGGNVVGFVSATESIGKLFVQMGTRHAGRFVPALVRCYARRPRLLVQSMQTVIYPVLTRTDEAQEAATAPEEPVELLSIMVAPSQRGQGIGSGLMHRLVEACAVREVHALDVTVDAANVGARRFYTRHGFVLCKEFSMYGRAMCLYRRLLAEEMRG